MSKKDCAPLVTHLQRRCDVEVHLGVAHDGCIKEERLLVSRLSVLHVDLACHTLNAIDYGRGTLRDLDTLEPLARNI